jgi:hypothetical protein
VDLLKITARLRRLGQREMTFVHGIEGTADQRDIHELRYVPAVVSR